MCRYGAGGGRHAPKCLGNFKKVGHAAMTSACIGKFDQTSACNNIFI